MTTATPDPKPRKPREVEARTYIIQSKIAQGLTASESGMMYADIKTSRPLTSKADALKYMRDNKLTGPHRIIAVLAEVDPRIEKVEKWSA